MNILVTMRSAQAVDYFEPRSCISVDWMVLFEKLKLTPILLPLGLKDYSRYFALEPKGILLTGGESLGTEPSRDRLEFDLIEQGIQHHLPILGICRGMQIINAFFGGGMTKHLPTNHVGYHDIIFSESKFDYQKGDIIKVNSYHNQGIGQTQVAHDFNIIAESSDQYIEYIEHKILPITGILWHPERENSAASTLDTLIFKNRFTI